MRFRGALRALLCVKYFTAAVPTVCVLAAAVCGLAAITAGVQSRCGPSADVRGCVRVDACCAERMMIK